MKSTEQAFGREDGCRVGRLRANQDPQHELAHEDRLKPSNLVASKLGDECPAGARVCVTQPGTPLARVTGLGTQLACVTELHIHLAQKGELVEGGEGQRSPRPRCCLTAGSLVGRWATTHICYQVAVSLLCLPDLPLVPLWPTLSRNIKEERF